MSEFDPAFTFLLPHEGGYVSDPADPGGETKYGISKSSYPDIDIYDLTVDDAKAIYLRDWWNPQRYAEITSQVVANKVFDLAVNMGKARAHKILQESVNDCGIVPPLACDGLLGWQTIQAVNSLDEGDLIQAMRLRASAHYMAIAQTNPAEQKFLNGWLRRANA